MNKPAVSIIIPVFGVEKYIERCARSLFEQTFDKIEFIFVDDCTEDLSIDVLKRVLDDYPQRKDSVKIIHHELNKGLPQTRRTGMLAASGDYIINFDSDDWVDTSLIQQMYLKAVEEKADIVICDMCLTNGQSERNVKGCYSVEKKELIKDLCTYKYIWSTCNKLIKRNLIDENCVFPKCNNGEDMAFTIPLVLKAERFSYVTGPKYYYYYNENSMTKVVGEEVIIKKQKMLLQNVEIVIDAFTKAGLNDEYRNIIDVVKFGAKKTIWSLVKKRKYFEIWKKTYKEINARILFNKNISLKEKGAFVLTYLRLYPRKNKGNG